MTTEDAASKVNMARLVTRIVIFGALGVLLVLAAIEYQQKNSALQSYNNLRDHQDSVFKEDGEVKWSDVESQLTGRYEITDEELDSSSFQYRSKKQIKWSGTFRSYSVFCYLGLGDDPVVMDFNASWEVPAEE